MTRAQIENELARLYRDRDFACDADGQAVCEAFNTDTKEEALEGIAEEIAWHEERLAELEREREALEEPRRDDGTDYKRLQLSQGMAAVYW